MSEPISLKEHFETLLREIDARYNQRFIDAEKLTNAAFAASEKAITKAEAAQNQYNATHNELSRKMDGQYAHMIPRTEMDAAINNLKEKIGELRESRSELAGKLWLPMAVIAAVAAGLGAAAVKLLTP